MSAVCGTYKSSVEAKYSQQMTLKSKCIRKKLRMWAKSVQNGGQDQDKVTQTEKRGLSSLCELRPMP